MSHDVVAIARRERVALAVVVAESRAPDGSGLLTLVAEDGARFPFPTTQVLARVAGGATTPTPGEATPQWLARLRAVASRPVDWRDVHAKAQEGQEFDAGDLAVLAGSGGDLGGLTMALASADAEPWFRRDGARWIAARRADAETKVARIEATHRAHAEDEALRAWWPRRAEGPPPDACRGALAAIADFALRGPVHDAERGRVLAAKLDLPEPDQALEALVAVGALPAAVNPAPCRAGLAEGFKRGAIAQAESVAATPVDPSGREDFSHLHAVAIDDAETTEVDDAISIREGPEGVELLVHISDVAALVPVGSALDKAAAERVSSLYMPESSVAMLPQPFVARMSLEEGAVREAVSGVFRVGDDGRVVHSRFARSLVRIGRRLTYEGSVEPGRLAASAPEGRRLAEIAERLRTARREAGAIVLQVESLKVMVAGATPRLMLRHQNTPGDLIVGESMVLFNREAARRLASIDAPAFYRTQNAPREPAPRPDDPLLALRVRRRFAPSNVSIEPGRHHGVGADSYLQATSPIRRFADLVNQRQLAAAIVGEKPPYNHADLERMVGHVVERERAVRVAADERTDFWVASAMAPLVGTTIEGVLSRAPRRGFGAVWTPSLCRELPLRSTPGWIAPAEGTPGTFRIARAAPWRGRIELEPAS